MPVSARRRQLMALAPVALGLRPGLPCAQEARPLSIGVLVNGAPGTPLSEAARSALLQAFADLGYTEGRTLDLRFVHAEGRLERLPRLAEELAASRVDLILTLGGPASRAAADATRTIPIVFSIVTDPVALRLVRSMEAPGGNVTGVTNLDREQARAQMRLLKEAAPSLGRVAILSDADIPGGDADGHAPIDRDNLEAARLTGLPAKVVKLKGPSPDLDGTFAALAAEGVDAVVALEVPVALLHRQRIAALATSHRMMSLLPGGTSDAGAVLTYGTTVADTWKRMPAIADRIAKGARAAEIPVETVARRELVVNLATAKKIGLELPPALAQRADRRID